MFLAPKPKRNPPPWAAICANPPVSPSLPRLCKAGRPRGFLVLVYKDKPAARGGCEEFPWSSCTSKRVKGQGPREAGRGGEALGPPAPHKQLP